MTVFTNSKTALRNTTFALAASALMLGLAAGPASASSVALEVNPQELATPAGRDRVEAQLLQAATKVCSLGDEDRSPASRLIRSGCVKASLADARAQVAALQHKQTIMLAAR